MANTLKYNEEIHKQIVAAITGGASHRAAAQALGVTPETLSHWKAKYPPLREDITRAEAEARAFAEMSFYREARKNPKVMLTWLERRYPAEWSGKRQQPDGIVVWPDSESGWTALLCEYQHRYREWLSKQAEQDTLKTAAAESPQNLSGATNGSDATALEDQPQGQVIALKSSGNGKGVRRHGTHGRSAVS